MSEDLILKIVALFIATVFSIAKLIKYNPLKEWKEDAIRDLDILSKLDENHYLYKVVNASADLSLLAIYSKDHHPWYSLRFLKNKLILILFISCVSAIILVNF